MANQKRMQLDEEILDLINGGALGFDPEPTGTYTMRCQYSGATFEGVALSQVIEIAKYCATIPNTPEGEQNIIGWAQEKGYIHQ
jgi:hypothetical protein